jgi:hypothetical protein
MTAAIYAHIAGLEAHEAKDFLPYDPIVHFVMAATAAIHDFVGSYAFRVSTRHPLARRGLRQ